MPETYPWRVTLKGTGLAYTIRLRWKELAGTNAVVYLASLPFTKKKSFITLTTDGEINCPSRMRRFLIVHFRSLKVYFRYPYFYWSFPVFKDDFPEFTKFISVWNSLCRVTIHFRYQRIRILLSFPVGKKHVHFRFKSWLPIAGRSIF